MAKVEHGVPEVDTSEHQNGNLLRASQDYLFLSRQNGNTRY